MQDGFLILVNYLANLGPEKASITRDAFTRSKIKIEWDSPFQDENQFVNIFCSGCYQGKGYKRAKQLKLVESDAAVQSIKSQVIGFNGGESDINITQVAPKVRHIIPLPKKVNSTPEPWYSTDVAGKKFKVEGVISLLEYVMLYQGGVQVPFRLGLLAPGGVPSTQDTGVMMLYFKREDAGQNTITRLSPQRQQFGCNGGINFAFQPPFPNFAPGMPPAYGAPPVPPAHPAPPVPPAHPAPPVPPAYGAPPVPPAYGAPPVPPAHHHAAPVPPAHAAAPPAFYPQPVANNVTFGQAPIPVVNVVDDMSMSMRSLNVETVTSSTVDLEGRSHEESDESSDDGGRGNDDGTIRTRDL